MNQQNCPVCDNFTWLVLGELYEITDISRKGSPRHVVVPFEHMEKLMSLITHISQLRVKDSVHPKVSCRECEVLFPQSRRDKQFCSNKCRYSWHSNRRRKAITLAVERGEL